MIPYTAVEGEKERGSNREYIVKINDVKLYAHNEFERERDQLQSEKMISDVSCQLVDQCASLLVAVVLFTFHDAYLLFELFDESICVCKSGFWMNTLEQ